MWYLWRTKRHWGEFSQSILASLATPSVTSDSTFINYLRYIISILTTFLNNQLINHLNTLQDGGGDDGYMEEDKLLLP
jgi:hypothetical protein